MKVDFWSCSEALALRECLNQLQVLNDRIRAMHHYRLPAISATYPPSQEDVPLTQAAEVVFDGDEVLSGPGGEIVPYAHRDIKPA